MPSGYNIADSTPSLLSVFFHKMRRAARFFSPSPMSLYATWKIWRSGQFDRAFYLECHPTLNALFRRFPERHYVMFGEAAGLQPNLSFSPTAYRELNPDLKSLQALFLHYVRYGKSENRLTRTHSIGGALRGELLPPVLRPVLSGPAPAAHAIVVHIYYPDLWEEISATIRGAGIHHDLFVTYTDRGALSDDLPDRIKATFPNARVIAMPNHGRDIFPFVHLVNSGLLCPYKAVCKIHTKRSPHRDDGDAWRRHLINGILPPGQTAEYLQRFLADPLAALWVADGQHYDGTHWWGSNFENTTDLLARVEIRSNPDWLTFPPGSMYWMKPPLLAMIRGMQLDQDDFELESAQLDGTMAHAFERAIGYIIATGELKILQTSDLADSSGPIELPSVAVTEPVTAPAFVSAFYLPQFHRIPENDAWWGKGYTEWQAAAAAKPQFASHAQPALPSALGFYDLLQPEVMAEQASLARRSGVDAFCVYFYFFDGKTLLDGPLRNLLDKPDIDFPFYLCWANESWHRHWDGLSGEVLLEQTYAPGFAQDLAQAALPYMQDPRYQRPDGARPRFVIYRPEDMPDPVSAVSALRAEWKSLGIGEVELGAVRFHISGDNEIPEGLFDFLIEMPPHGLVTAQDYLVGGPTHQDETEPVAIKPAPGFSGLIYDYEAVIANSVDPSRDRPDNLIAGIMPSWDNTARRGRLAHLAYGANPVSFARWLRALSEHRLAGSYRRELMINSWNEWAEKAALEPSRQYDTAWLDALQSWRQAATEREGQPWHD